MMTRTNWRAQAGVPVAGLLLTALALGCGDGHPGVADTHASSDGTCPKTAGTICTVAGTGIAGDGADGQAALATRLYLPQDVTVGPDGRLYVVDWNNHRIRVVNEDGTMTIVAGIGELGANGGRSLERPAEPSDQRDVRPTGRPDGHRGVAQQSREDRRPVAARAGQYRQHLRHRQARLWRQRWSGLDGDAGLAGGGGVRSGR